MLRVLIFIILLFLALPYINKAKNTFFDKVPNTISLKKIGDKVGDSISKSFDKTKK